MRTVKSVTFKQELENRAAEVEKILAAYGTMQDKSYQKTVMEAMEYSLFAGGKRLRPILLQETFRMFGGTGSIVEPFMAAIEMIHTYSLVHDDLPAMDNDLYRRGKKTTHAVYGEDMAILTGDALLNYAFETAGKAFDMAEPEELPYAVAALRILAAKAGIYGMVGGQVFDVEAENKDLPLTEEQLLFIFRLKTSALIEASLMAGAALAGAGTEEIDLLSQIGTNVGIAFQIRDDILDVISTQEVLGKPIGSDERNNKTTYVTLKGLAQAEADVRAYTEKAQALLEQLPSDSTFLHDLIDSLTDRMK
ncbi:MAG: polyprenyl synthetase family protein [Lachnospiraceae bacterium]|nr:polyprenyl synthetase family protein [Lachnospiraceae bacterium]